MWFNERYTLSRGRWEVPRIFLRIRSCTCRRFAFFDDCVSIASVLGHITREIPRCARDDASRARASACSGATEQSEVVEWSRLNVVISLPFFQPSSSISRPRSGHLCSCTDQVDAVRASPPQPVPLFGGRCQRAGDTQSDVSSPG